MSTTRIGVLSDTHLYQPSAEFERVAQACFADVSILFHAGDLTSHAILQAFRDKEVYAVHGNMCDHQTRNMLPRKRIVEVGAFSFGLIHKPKHTLDFEYGLMNEFDVVDCIVYGHTHHASWNKQGDLLFVNPGSFKSTGPYGAPGTFAILEVDTEIRCHIHEIPTL